MNPEDLDHTKLGYGKYRGLTPSEVAQRDAWYVVNVLRDWKPKIVSDALVRDCKRDLENEALGRREE